MGRIRCFLLTDTGGTRYSLRRYSCGAICKCPGNGSYHNAQVHMSDSPDDNNSPLRPPKSDPRWPTKCDHCDYAFVDEDNWQVFPEAIYRTQEGAFMTLRNAPAGAMWFCDWMPWKGADGHSLVVKTPGGEWCVDSQASNCTRKDDKVHRCWIRHGSVPDITAFCVADSWRTDWARRLYRLDLILTAMPFNVLDVKRLIRF
jgi:hypothetical protein